MNNTIKQIAINSCKKNISRSVLTGIAIFLTTFLLTMIGLSAKGIIDFNLETSSKLNGDYYGAYARVNEKSLKSIKSHAEIYDVGVSETFAMIECKSMTAGIAYMDKTAIKVSNIGLEEGAMPEKENEIVAARAFFIQLGIQQPKLGDTVELDYRINNVGEILSKSFVISGFLPASEVGDLRKIYKALVSEEFYTKSLPENDRNYTVCFKVLGKESLNFEQMEKKIYEIATQLIIEKKNVVINTGYLIWVTDPGTEIILTCVSIAIIVILFSILVIYNIFHVAIIQRTQDYGRIRALGATKKQLKQMVLSEGTILALFSISLGLLVGCIGTDIFFGFIIEFLLNGRNIVLQDSSVFNLPILIFVSIVSLFTVFISLTKPMKMASSVSPIEAMKYQESSLAKTSRNGYQEISLLKLTMANLSRNKKRTIITILTMGLSCILFVVVANVLGSMDANYTARLDMEKGDFCISLDARINDETYPENNIRNVQQSGLLSQNFVNRIKAIDGVTEVESRKIISLLDNKETIMEDDRYSCVEVLSKENFEKQSKICERGEVNYDLASKNNGILFGYDYWIEDYGYHIGDKISFILYDGNKEIAFEGVLQGSIRRANARFIMTQDTFESLGFTQDMTLKLFIKGDKNKLEAIRTELEGFISENEYYELHVFADILESIKLQMNFMLIPSYLFLMILGVIGFANMANTMVTGIITRRRELGILQAIGLTPKQLNLMLQMEGMIFTAGTLLVSLSLGNFLGYWAFLELKKVGFIGLKEYHFPLPELVVMLVILVLMQVILSLCMSRSLQKESIIDRIRHQ